VEQRVALLIATGEYSDPLLRRLRAPAQDIDALATLLTDPDVGDFAAVHTVVDRPRQEVEEAIENAFADRRPGDIVLVYFTCHGVKDPLGRLYFAASNTRHDRLASTAVSSAFVNEQMERSRASAKVALLDCCYSGSFAKGLAPKAGLAGDLTNQICGRGSYVITATDSLEYAYEGSSLTEDNAVSSSFTEVLVQGLRSGRADWDGDGLVSPEDLFWYLDKEFQVAGRPQTPTSFSSGVQGAVAIAKAPRHARPAEQGAAAADDLRRMLRDLEVRYSSIREVLPSGGRRTALLDDIPPRAGALSVTAQQLGLFAPRLASFTEDSEGARIVTIALCDRVEQPTGPVVAVLVDGIRNSRSAFEQYWALSVATSLLYRLAPEHRTALRDAARAMIDSGIAGADSNRVQLAGYLLNHPST
jgi:Caspase domain